MYSRAGKETAPGLGYRQNRKNPHRYGPDPHRPDQGKSRSGPPGRTGRNDRGFKGFGYATVVEVLSAALQDGSFLKSLNGFDDEGNRIPYPLGHFFMAINTENFMGEETFRKVAGNIMRDLRNSEVAPGEERIFTAGEKEHLARKYRMEHGCPVPPALQKVMTELNGTYKLGYDLKWDK